jgi:phage gpG-like protein
VKLQTSVSGGDRLGTKLRQIRERLQKNSGVLVGLPAGTGSYEDGAPIAVIAAVHEFGSADGRIPERSFLRVPLRQNAEGFKKAFQAMIPKVVDGEMTMHQVMSQLGARAVAVSQEAISDGIEPANAESTIARKGSSKPLIDTGALRQSITFVVED